MPIDEGKLYEEIGHTWRHFASWREKSFGGYLTVLAGLAIGFSQNTSAPARAAIFAAGILVSAVFWILDYRNAQFINACQRAAAPLEGTLGCYANLNQARFAAHDPLTYRLAINMLVGGVSAASVGGLWIHLARWCGGSYNSAPFVATAVLAIAIPALLERIGYKQRSVEETATNTPPNNG